MSLQLIVGPANAGKVAELYRRYLARVDAGGAALLVTPTRALARAAQGDLLRRRPAVVGGGVVTLDDVIDRVAGADAPPVVAGPARHVLLRRLVGREAPGLRGGADALARLADRLGDALVDPDALAAAEPPGPAVGLYRAWWAEQDRLGIRDRGRRRVEATRRLATVLDAWDGTHLFVWGFEDLTTAQETVLRLVGGRAGVTVTLPYEPGRPAFAAVRVAFERLAPGAARLDELAAATDGAPPALLALARRLFDEVPRQAPAPPDERALVLHEAAGARAEADLVVQAVAEALRAGTPADRIAVILPREPGSRPDLVEALRAAEIPARVEGRTPLGATTFGHVLGRLLRAAWDADATRDDLVAVLRSPWSGLPRRRVDGREAMLRGRGVVSGTEAEAVLAEAFGGRLPYLHALRAPGDPVPAVAGVVRAMAAAALGLGGRAPAPADRPQVAAVGAALGALEALAAMPDGAGASREEVRAALDRVTVPGTDPEHERVLVTDAAGARGRSLDVGVVVGLEDERFGAAALEDPLLGEEARVRLGDVLTRADPGDLARHRLYVAVTRPRVRAVLVRRGADEDGRELVPSALVEELVAAAGGSVPGRRRGLGDVAFGLAEAPTERERLRALCRLGASEPARARRLAAGTGHARRLERAAGAFARRTALRDPRVLSRLEAQQRFSVTALERFSECSSWWFAERLLDPREIDAGLDAKLRGSVAHTALQRFFRGLPALFGKDRLAPEDADRAAEVARSLVAEALAAVTVPTDTVAARAAEHRLAEDVAALVRHEARQPSPLAPGRFEVAFGGGGAAPGLKEGLDLGGFAVTGKIDRIDVDPGFSARALVHDYKTGSTAWSADEIRREGRLQLPLYALAVRELLGLEPVGVLYRALGGGGTARGMLDADHGDALPPDATAKDVLDHEAFWEAVGEARAAAAEIVGRIRAGDVRHDPRGGTCATWCPCATVCRVPRR